MTADTRVAGQFDVVRQALDTWSDGGPFEPVTDALRELENSITALETRHPSEKEFSRDDRVVWFIKKYLEASHVVAQMQGALQKAEAAKTGMHGLLMEAVAVRPAVPIYGVKLFQGLQALGLGQKELNQVGRTRLLRAKEALTSSLAPEPRPLWQWSDLPREVGDYRLVDVELETDGEPIVDFSWRGPPIPLPPFVHISEFSPDGSTPEEQETRKKTYDEYTTIIYAWWAKREGKHCDIWTLSAWLVLLGHQLPRSQDGPERQLLEVVIASPWDTGRAVRPEWLGRPDTAE